MKRNLTLTNRVRLIVLAVVAAGAAACGPFHKGSGPPPAYLIFTNESLDQADVFAVLSANQPIRIGTVIAGRTDTLTVPPEISSRGENVNIVARLLARSARPSSGPIPIHPGDRLAVRLPVDQKMLVVLPTGQ
jgi:hypothetical protein